MQYAALTVSPKDIGLWNVFSFYLGPGSGQKLAGDWDSKWGLRGYAPFTYIVLVEFLMVVEDVLEILGSNQQSR